MWKASPEGSIGLLEFFRLSVGHSDLKDYYTMMHLLRYNFKYQSDSIETMIPWELEVEMSMVCDSLQKELRMKQSANGL